MQLLNSNNRKEENEYEYTISMDMVNLYGRG
jgi:hypothetical protein